MNKPEWSVRALLSLSFSLLILILLNQTLTAQTLAARSAAGKLLELTVPAASLKGNLLGDPAEQRVNVYLPPSYDSSPEKRYPALYLLHGYNGKIEDFSKNGYQDLDLPPRMDSIIKNGEIKEMIVVVPNGTNAYRGSYFANSPATGNWEDFIYQDLVSYIDANYRTLARPASRGIAGHSMGGYGAIMMGMKHADVFGAIYALSPCCLGLEGDFGADNAAWMKALKVTSRDIFKSKPQSYEDFWADVFVSISAAFSPDPAASPMKFGFPYKEVDGRLVANEPAYSRFRSHMPLYLVEQYREPLLKLRGIYLDYGQYEEFSHIRLTTREFSDELTQRGIPHTFEVYKDGDHGNHIRERLETRVLKFFSERLVFEP